MPRMTKEEIIEKMKTIKGTEFKMDFTVYDDGAVVECFVAQCDIDKGFTVRGVEPFSNPNKTGDDVDLYCLNKKFIGGPFDNHKVYSEEQYLADMQGIIEAAEAGIHIVPEAYTGSTTCAF